MTENISASESPAVDDGAAVADPTTAPVENPAAGDTSTEPVENSVAADSPPATAPTPSPVAAQTSMAAPRGLSYAVDIVFCIDVTGSMTSIIDAVKANALGPLR